MDIKLEFLIGEEAVVSSVLVNINTQVKAGDELLRYEAAKGILPILAPEDGVVAEIFVGEGDSIDLNTVLLHLRTAGEQPEGNVSPQAVVMEPEEESADLLIIGAGPGGYEAAIYAAQSGLKVILVEAAKVGGTCLNEGCIPTKALSKAAKTYQEIQKASKMGIDTANSTVNMTRLIAWKDTTKEILVSGILSLLKHHEVKLITGIARFLSEHEVIVEQQNKRIKVSASNIIIATGSKTAELNIPGAQLPVVMDSRMALSLKELPESITVIGGGVIGMEFAFIYHSLGVKVQVIEYAKSILPMLDQDISESIQAIAERKGIIFRTGAKVKRIETGLNEEAVVIYEKDGKEGLAVSKTVLMAVGRMPALEGLNVEAAGIEIRENGRGIPVNAFMQTNRPWVYAIGDVNNMVQLAHAASHQGISAVKHILGDEDQEDQHLIPNVIFTMPEIASVGKTEAVCREEKMAYEVYKFPFSGNGKALIMGDSEGFVKLIKNSSTNEIIGGSIIGPDASALINTITELVQFHIRQEQAAKLIFPHPTTGEAILESIWGLGSGAVHCVNKKEVFHVFD